MAVGKQVPRWPPQEVLCTRQPRGFEPRGPLRGGPERPADDPQRKPQDRLCGGPARSAKEPQLSHKSTTRAKAKGGKEGNQETKKRPTIITVDKGGAVRNWGPLSRINAWRAGGYIEDMDGAAQVFLEKDNTRRAVEVEKLIKGEREWFWFREKIQEPQQELREK